MSLKSKILILSVIISTLYGAVASFNLSSAQQTETIDVSAYLVSSTNEDIPNGEYEVRFALYTANREQSDPYPSDSDRASRVWEETQKVKVYDGVLNADLGSVTPLPSSLFFSNGTYYLGIRIRQDSEMVPRKKVNAVPLAIDSFFLRGHTVGTAAGNIPFLDDNGQLDSGLIPEMEISVSGSSYLSASGMEITASKINLASHVTGTLSAAYGGTGDNTSGITGVPYIEAGDWLYETTVDVTRGGTGLSSIGAGSILYADADNSLAALTGTAADDGETLTFNWNGGVNPSVSWETAAGSGDIIAVGNVASGNAFTSGGSGSSLWFHSGANTGELTVAALTGNRTYTLPNESGTICATGSVCTGYQAAGNYLTTATIFGGDVSGAYNAIVVANDSHTHAAATLPANVSYLGSSIDLVSEVSGTLAATSGGTGIATYTTGDVLYASAANTLSRLSAGAEGRVLTISGGIPAWQVSGGAAHNLLSATHLDTTSASPPVRGDLITGQAGLTWASLALGTSGYILRSNGTDVTWSPTTNITQLGTITTGTWNATDVDISDYTNLAVSGALLNLTGDTLSINEGTLTDTRLCTYDLATTSLVCDTSSGSVGHTPVTLAGTPDYLTIDGSQVITRGTIDISDDTNLAGDTEIVLTGDALSIASAITRDSEWDTWAEHPALTSAYILVGNASNQAVGVAVSGDVSITNAGVTAVADDSHAHTTTTISGLDISDDTNLAVTAGTLFTMANDTLTFHEGTLTDARLCTYDLATTSIVCDTSSGSVGHTPVTLTGTPDYLTIDGSQVITRGTIDISDDTNLTATTGIVLTGDQLTHSTANGYVHIPGNGASAQILQYSSAGTAKWITVSGDVTIADGGAITVADDSHAHTTTTISGLDISSDTNLTVSGTLLNLTGDTLSVNEGTLTDARLCTYNLATTSIICDTSPGGVGASHNLLDGTYHPDTTAGTVAQGDLITGQGATPKWAKLTIGGSGEVLLSDGTDVYWGSVSGGGGGGISPDSLDFTEFADAMTLDSNLTISASAGNYSINIDSNTLYVDTANNRVGIGTNIPSEALSVGANAFTVSSAGTVTAGVWNGTDIDISDYTNLATGTLINLTGDAISFRAGTLTDARLCTYDLATTSIVCDTSSGSVGHTPVTLAGTPDYLTIDGNQVITRGTIDISDDTNLAGDTEIVLTGDALSIASALTRDTELSAHAALTTGTHGVTGMIVGTSDSQALTGKTYEGITISSGTGTLTLNSYTLALTASASLNQNLLTTSTPTFQTLTLGNNGSGNGQLALFEDTGNYTITLNPNASATGNANFYLPADEPGATYILNMTSGGVIGFDTSTYLTSEADTLTTVTGRGATTTTAVGLQNSQALTLGLDAATNTAGWLQFIGAGANNFSTIFVADTQTQNITYTLPPDDGSVGYVLVTDGNGDLSWSATVRRRQPTLFSTVLTTRIRQPERLPAGI